MLMVYYIFRSLCSVS